MESEFKLALMAYLLPDKRWDAEATQLVLHRQIGIPILQQLGFVFECHSSLATQYDEAAIPYSLFVGLDGSASCNCKDFQGWGGACKHI